MSLPWIDGTALRASVLAGATSVREAVEACLERIGTVDRAISAFASVQARRARKRADELDRALAEGARAGPLFGIPVAFKSNMCIEGFETRCGSRILRGYRPPYTATFVRRALDAGCVPIGTTHMDEFAMGSSGENSAWARTRNPWDLERAPGGSSSGSAAAVAAGMVPLALGSDTGGSVRQPAALCGVSGFKPTYGRVSRYGLVAFGSSLDQVGPLARSARDVERVLSVIAGHDPLDATTLDAPAPGALHADDLTGVRIGVPAEYLHAGLDAGVRARVEEAIADLEDLGARVHDVALPHTRHALAAYYVVATAEASSNLARYDGTRYGLRRDGDGTLAGMMAATRDAGFGDEVKRRILLGTYVLSSGYQEAWYGRALAVRGRIAEEFRRAFAEVDLIVGPTSPTPAFRLGERRDDPLAMYLSDVLTVPASLAGLPAASVPCGLVRVDGTALPVGLQLLGRPEADAEVLRAARVYQAATDHHRRVPGEPPDAAEEEDA